MITIWVEDLCDELYGGGFCGVFLRELEREAESATLPGRVFGAEYDGVPEEHVAFQRGAYHPRARVFLQGPLVSYKPSLSRRSHVFLPFALEFFLFLFVFYILRFENLSAKPNIFHFIFHFILFYLINDQNIFICTKYILFYLIFIILFYFILFL